MGTDKSQVNVGNSGRVRFKVTQERGPNDFKGIVGNLAT